MAHDFTIRVPNGIWSKRYDVITVGNEHIYIEKDEYKGVPSDEVFFFGYADGIFYKAFRCEECNNAMSGNGSIYLISHDTAEKKLKKAINEFYKLNYPNPTRINDIKEFYDRMKHDYKNVEYFEIIFD